MSNHYTVTLSVGTKNISMYHETVITALSTNHFLSVISCIVAITIVNCSVVTSALRFAEPLLYLDAAAIVHCHILYIGPCILVCCWLLLFSVEYNNIFI